jgi:glutaredoxin
LLNDIRGHRKMNKITLRNTARTTAQNTDCVAKISGGILLALLALLALPSPAQTVYRIVGADGKVTFSDKPPLTDDKVTATGRGGKVLEIAGATLPFELRQVVSRYPVTLYTSNGCVPCGSGRAFLTSRGVPFTERTVNTPEDGDALTRLGGENVLPIVMIGGQKLKGFSDTEWTQFLDAAGYPATSKLPPNFRNSAATPLVAVQRPVAPVAPAAAPVEPVAQRPAPADSGSNPAGIKF